MPIKMVTEPNRQPPQYISYPIDEVMAVRPELPDLGQLDADRAVWPQGVAGEDPRDATAAHGEQCLDLSVQVVGQMLQRAGI